MSKDILIVGDPWETLDIPRDSTLYLTTVARNDFGMRSFWALPENLFFRNDRMFAKISGEVVSEKLEANGILKALDEFHSVHWRADPPVDLRTLRLWSLLDCYQASPFGSRTKLVNPPRALLSWNEKFSPLRFHEWAIASLVADSMFGFEAFFHSHPQKRLIAKPAAEAASRGVQFLPTTWQDASEILKQMQTEFGPWLVLQEFEASIIRHGETRVFLVAGEIAGAIQKNPKTEHVIMNLDAPPENQPTMKIAPLRPLQKERATFIGQTLAKEGVHLATLDFIGDKILEINVTSPGLIRWYDSQVGASEKIATKYWAKL
ncbi:MAG: hypothetical protein AB1540_09070 [Bdellovibrionota bacterium]